MPLRAFAAGIALIALPFTANAGGYSFAGPSGHLVNAGDRDADVSLDLGPGPAISFGGGYTFNNGFGLELFSEYGWSQVDEIDGFEADGDAYYITAMPTLTFGQRTGNIEPRFGIGAGVFHTQFRGIEVLDVEFEDDDDTDFAAQASASILFHTSEKFAIGPIYRFRYIDDLRDYESTFMHVFELSARAGF